MPSLLEPVKYEIREAATPSDGIDWFIQQFPMMPLGFGWQSLRAEVFPDPAREKREADSSSEGGEGGASLDFVGEAVDLPPFGWVDAMGGHYVDWFGEGFGSYPRGVLDDEETREAHYRSLSLWRSGGFTLWDRRRVEAMEELSGLRTLQTGWAVHGVML